MSFDPQQPDVEGHSNYSANNPNSSKKWWILGGIGCFSALVVCCGGTLAFYFILVQPAQKFLQEQIVLAESSTKVQELLGDDARVDIQSAPDVSTTNTDGNTQITYKYNMTGANGSGKLIIVGRMVSMTKWEQESMMLEMDGVEHDLDPEAELDGLMDGIDLGD